MHICLKIALCSFIFLLETSIISLPQAQAGGHEGAAVAAALAPQGAPAPVLPDVKVAVDPRPQVQQASVQSNTAQQHSIWQRAKEEMSKHPRVIYVAKDHKEAFDGLGFITSNEENFYQFSIKKSPADLHIGFGSIINFNLLGARPGAQTKSWVFGPGEKTRTAIFADISQEVVLAMMHFWRSVWIAAETPQEWFSFIVGIEFKPKMTMDEVFKSFKQLRNDPNAPNSVPVLTSRLEALVQAGTLSKLDRDFTLAVIDDQVKKVKPQRMGTGGFFPSARGGLDIASRLLGLYLVDDSEKPNGFIEVNANSYHQVLLSFLYNQESFARIKRMYEEQKDYYALTSLDNLDFWTQASMFAEKHTLKLTDAYFSNIFYFLGQAVESDTARAAAYEKYFKNFSHSQVSVYLTDYDAGRGRITKAWTEQYLHGNDVTSSHDDFSSYHKTSVIEEFSDSDDE